jgi:quercetin 2,3-dioxygenase
MSLDLRTSPCYRDVRKIILRNAQNSAALTSAILQRLISFISISKRNGSPQISGVGSNQPSPEDQMFQIRFSSTLDSVDLGWLKAKHHFIVRPDGNPANSPLGALVVWNDDEIVPGMGFGLHGHFNMEIISYVRDGVVTHRDSIGNTGRAEAGDVQVMSAGAGIRHSEHNLGTEPLRLFQIWLRPRVNGGKPYWNTRRFPKDERADQLVVLASGLPGDNDALPIRADARVVGATLRAGAQVRHELGDFRYAYLAPARGAVKVNGLHLAVGDGIAVLDEQHLTISAEEDSEVILVATH